MSAGKGGSTGTGAPGKGGVGGRTDKGGPNPGTGGSADAGVAAGDAGPGPGGAGADHGTGGTGGSAGHGVIGGQGGEPPCGCDGPCLVPPDEFCHALGCPLTLSAARRLDAFCEHDAMFLEYADCDGFVTITYAEGGENDYELVFDEAAGDLVFFEASIYGGSCDVRKLRGGERPP